jgi:hypothetical protein
MNANGREFLEMSVVGVTNETLRTTDGTEKNLWIGFSRGFWVSRITGLWFVSDRLSQAF